MSGRRDCLSACVDGVCVCVCVCVCTRVCAVMLMSKNATVLMFTS